MAKRVFEIAKELGVDSKAVVKKCQAEGIPESVIKNHMSTVSLGLEATIREWFSEGAHATAVETSERVDLAKVRARGRKRTAKADGERTTGDDAGATAGVAVEDGTETEALESVGAEPGPEDGPSTSGTPSAGERVNAQQPEGGVTLEATERADPVVSKPSTPPTGAAPAPLPAAAEQPPAAASEREPSGPGFSVYRPRVVTLAPAKKPELPAAPAAHVDTPAATGRPADRAPDGRGASGAVRPSEHRTDRPQAVQPRGVQHRPGQSGSSGPSVARPGTGGGEEDGGRGPQERGAPAPAPQNIPRRPKDVKPVALKPVELKPVKLSGPKIVRIEAPENLPTPRPRGPMGPSSGGPGFGPSDGDDRGRRFGPGPAPGGGTEGGDRDGAPKRKPPVRGGAGVPSRRSGRADEVLAFRQGWTEQDLAERQARLARSGGFVKKHRKDLGKPGIGGERAVMPAEKGGKVRIVAPFTIKELSAATGVKGADIVKKLFLQGVMATINSGIEVARAQEIMMDYEIELDAVEAASAEEVLEQQAEGREREDERPRGPVVTIMGHVDHGKTSLLDRIRNTNVAAGEAGGITQATSAFRVPVRANEAEKHIVFIDTPGHEAFTAMRSRGANITDIVVLVVAGDDGVMPQTVESINHAKAAEVPIVVALSKCDKPEATDRRMQEILGQLASHGVNTVPWGGETELVRVSAHTGMGIQDLLNTLDLQAEVLELKADFAGAAQGSVLEASYKEGRGSVATVVVQEGQLNVGDFIVAGRAFGRVRDITDDKGKRLKEVLPPAPVQISGIDELPDAGDTFYVVGSLRQAQEAAEQRRQRERERQLAQPKVTLDSLFGKMAEQDIKEIKIVLKADVQGSVDVLRHEIEKVATSEVKTRVLHSAVGGITESDVLLAEASGAVIVGFNVIPSGKARSLADAKGVEIRTYDVIYHITEDMRKAAEGLLAPELRQEILGHAEVRAVFKITKVGSIAGCYVTDGTVQRDAMIRVTRNGIVIENDRRLEQLKRFKDDAKDVRAGMECGMKIVGYDDIKEGDILECYKQVEVKRTL